MRNISLKNSSNMLCYYVRNLKSKYVKFLFIIYANYRCFNRFSKTSILRQHHSCHLPTRSTCQRILPRRIIISGFRSPEITTLNFQINICKFSLNVANPIYMLMLDTIRKWMLRATRKSIHDQEDPAKLVYISFGSSSGLMGKTVWREIASRILASSALFFARLSAHSSHSIYLMHAYRVSVRCSN